ncbi:MAG: hypothetical protein WC783_00180 [Candidatus Paceibacterota bacterium]|jgi:hypothetical protein
MITTLVRLIPSKLVPKAKTSEEKYWYKYWNNKKKECIKDSCIFLTDDIEKPLDYLMKKGGYIIVKKEKYIDFLGWLQTTHTVIPFDQPALIDVYLKDDGTLFKA